MKSLTQSIRRWGAAFSLGWLLSATLYAQADLPSLPLAQVNRPTGWQLAGSVVTGPGGSPMKTGSPGSSVLIGTNQPLTLVTPTDDFRLRFEVMTTANAGATLALPGGQPINLDRSPDLARLLKAPGLWQTIELWYRTGGVRGPATLEKLVINGVTVREGQVLAGKTTGPLTMMAANGTIAVRNVGYRVLTPRNVARWSSPLSYTIVEGGYIQDPEEALRKNVLKQDTTAQLNYEVAYGQPRGSTLFFTGKLDALQPGAYQFELNQGGLAALWVDGKPVIPIDHRELGHPSVGSTNLTAGPHEVRVYFSRSWFRPGLGLFVAQAGTRPQPLHALASLPEPDPVGVISVVPEARPQLVRSFVQMPGEKTKRTHSLSVGSPAGLHYTLDLNQMALLQAWKGDFADVTEMWYERGEPQLLSPMGTTVRLPGQPALLILTNENIESTTAAWPDSVDENTLQYKGFTLDKQGFPTVEYEMGGATVTDAIRPGLDSPGLDSPEGAALVRTLTVSGSPDGTPYCRVAAGKLVEEVGKGLYAINDRSYYVRFDPKAKLKLRQSGEKQELLLPVAMKDGKGAVQYSIVF